MKISVAKITNPGGRAINDDTVCIFEDKKAAHVFVGDGLGGYAGGQQASMAAGDVLMRSCKEQSMLTKEALLEAAERAQGAVLELQEKTEGNMKTTMVYLAIEGESARWMHIGDSRLYRFENGKLAFQTSDHSVSQMAVRMGEITPEQIRFHEDRNRVLRALGGESAKAEVSEPLKIGRGKTAFLLCTDGFWEYVYEKEMEQTLRQAKTPEQWLQSMEQILKERVSGDNDNYTAAAVLLHKVL